jgi:predicted nucleic acid-binding protein
VCRDEKDQIFLDLAAVGAAHWLVTGDKDLLDPGGQVRFRIIAPAARLVLASPNRFQV